MFHICPNCRHRVPECEQAAYGRCEDCWVLNYLDSHTPPRTVIARTTQHVGHMPTLVFGFPSAKLNLEEV